MHPSGRHRWPGRHATAGKFLCINILLLLLLHNATSVGGLRKGKLVLPSSYTALGDDLDIQLHADPLELATVGRLKLQIARTVPGRGGTGAGTVATTLDIRLDANHNVTQIKVPCQHFLRGGDYELAVLEEAADPGRTVDERLRQPLHVDWPTPRLSITPNRTDTYPDGPVQGLLEFEQVRCQLPATDTLDLPELWLELFYCGKSADSCTGSNGTGPASRAQVLYIEQVRGLPRRRPIDFRCNLFGLAGFYALHLRPTGDPTAGVLQRAHAILQADWSKQYVFTVHTRSIFPCDPHGLGIRVLFQYPACILQQADRVRLYAKLRADVLSLAPPTSLHYVAEQRVSHGQHSLHFECDLFYEKFVEYCFVYVSQAISGAVADIRMDCVPTLPVSASDSGGWGPWSNWTHCSTTCRGGIRNRYRFCDSPPPRYGAKFCEGASVQTERCGLESSRDSWECMFSPAIGNINLPLEIEDVNTEIGPGCRCGCVIHLGMVKPKRLLGSSSHSCPDRSLWLIKGDEGCRIRMTIDFQRFPCDGQWLKVRDGDSVADELLLQFGADQTGVDAAGGTTIAEASGSVLLVEFFSRKTEHFDEACNAGFLGQAEQMKPQNRSMVTMVAAGNDTTIASKVIMPIVHSLRSYARFTVAHVCAIAFICFIVLVSFLLVVQYLFRYRKYELATSRMEAADSPAHTLFGSSQSLDGTAAPMQPRSRAVSTTTLISEIVSYVKLRPLRVATSIRHERFRESVEYALESTRSEGAPSDGSTEQIMMELQDRGVEGDEKRRQREDADEETPLQSLNDLNHPEARRGDEPTPRAKRKAARDSDDECSATASSAYSSLDREKTPLMARKNDITDHETHGTLKGDQHLVKSATCLMATSSTSTATLTNVSPSDVECCSPPDPGVQSPLVRRNTGTSSTRGTRSAKESKEKRNLQKLLAGSDFSLGAPSEQDMELDYYDYNVINAGAAPGSYLGMDPAFLVWIPPLDGEEDSPKDPGASDDDDGDDGELTELANRVDRRGEGADDSRSSSVTPSAELIRQLAEQKRNDYIIVSHSISKSDVCSESDGDTKLSTGERRRRKLHELILVRRKAGSHGGGGAGGGDDSGSGSSVRKSSSDESTEEREKETSFTKSSPVDNKQISDFYEMADIAFADDEADEEEEEDDEKDCSPECGGFGEEHPKGGTLLPSARKMLDPSNLEGSKYQSVVNGGGDRRQEDDGLVQ